MTRRAWGSDVPATAEQTQVNVETGRGNMVPVDVGSPFVATMERVADEANYGGYFRVFLNSAEIRDPDNAPATVEAGMRIQITSYDKVGT